MVPKFKNILIKLSGEGLAGENKQGINSDVVLRLAQDIKTIHDLGVKINLVIGGGNFFRGARNACQKMDRSVADQIGMLATIMNALALKSALESLGCPVIIYSGLKIPAVCDDYSFRHAQKSLTENAIIIFAGGTGHPYFTTDTAAVLRATEMHCDVLLKATQVDGVYSADPRVVPQAKRYDAIAYREVIAEHFQVMDLTAIALAQDNRLPIMIFAQQAENALLNAVCKQGKYTIIEGE